MENNTSSTSNQNPLDQSFVMQEQLPNSTAVLVLGILSIVCCFCYGVIGIVLGIIAIVLASKAKNLYNLDPGKYTQASFKNMKAGRICAVVGLCLSVAYIMVLVVYFIFVGAALTGLFSSGMMH